MSEPSSDEPTLLAVGLPGSGKSTFLAALWHLVEQGRLRKSLTVKHLDVGDRTYLNLLARDWADRKPLERTYVTGGATIRMSLRAVSSGQTINVHFPDLAGEVFRDAWGTRSWPEEVARSAAAAAGILLFIHPDAKEAPRLDRMNNAVARAGEAEAPIVPNTPSGAAKEEDTVKWDVLHAPHAVILVDLLQAILRTGSTVHSGGQTRVAVIVSAWDLVDASVRYGSSRQLTASSADPVKWLSDLHSLLMQFLSANASRIEARIYGITAQGGQLEADASALGEAIDPEERIFIRPAGANNGGDLHHDLSAIMLWVAGGA